MLRKFMGALVGLAFFGMVGTANATIIFGWTGTSSSTGSLSIDESLFDGTSNQSLSNTNITAFSFAVTSPTYGAISFSLGDVVTISGTIYNSMISPPDIVNGAGFLADNGTFRISMGLGNLVGLWDSTQLQKLEDYNGDWEAVAVPEPATLAIFGVGLVGIGFMRRRRKTAHA